MKKKCSKCRKTRLLKFFNKGSRYRMGVTSWCKTCIADHNRTPEAKERNKRKWIEYISDPTNREYERKRSREKYWRDPKKYKDQVLRRLFGVSLKKFQRTKKCLLCQRKVKRLVADHNHKTDTYRGVLCVTCNLMLGWIERFPNMLRKIEEYLRRG